MHGTPNTGAAVALVNDMYRSAIAAADPEAAVMRHLSRDGDSLVLDGRRWPVRGQVVIVGAGKAAVAMGRAIERICDGLNAHGILITKDGHASGPLLAQIEIAEASHPIPDQRGVEATTRLLAKLGGLRHDDLVLALISGGGSALLEAPREGVTLDDMARVTELLLRAGAPIQDLNAVRRPLSQVKGGGIFRAAGDAAILSLILSDVLGNDPHVIASGPTIPAPPTADGALAILERYGLQERVPASVVEALGVSPSLPGSGVESEVDDDCYSIVADNETAITAAVAEAERVGKRVNVLWRNKEGEAASLGSDWVRHCQAADPSIDVLVGGGEATVRVHGDGVGGRNTEFALSAALSLNASTSTDWAVASLATDGQDGPTGAAGAIADPGTIHRAMIAGVDPTRALATNDSMRVFEAAGGLISPGPTGTNVNDLYFAVRLPS